MTKENPSLSLNYDEFLKVLNSKSHQLVDTRPICEFDLENSLLGKNHFEDAINFPYQDLFDPNTGTIKDKTELSESKFLFLKLIQHFIIS